ncbi:hypothetical protein ABPG75_005721 [Micractinium tetrahymenae]
MALLVRIARQSELPKGGKIVKEAHGRKILLARQGGAVYATDAHCYHMGGNLWEGDIEDIGGHACVVCPLHRYKIDMSTGQKVDTDLHGCVTCSPGQQQRTYRVYPDPDFIRIDIPELHSQPPLPSDRYNQVAQRPAGFGLAGPSTGSSFGLAGPSSAPAGGSTPGRGLFGVSTGRGLGGEGLTPYGGSVRAPLVPPGPGTPSKEAAEDEPALVLSQEAPQLGAPPAPPPQQQFAQQQQATHQYTQSQIPFAQSRVDTARIARRKAATEAIKARMYAPPSAPPLAPPPQRPAAPGQQSLFSFGFTKTAVSTGPEEMDMS